MVIYRAEGFEEARAMLQRVAGIIPQVQQLAHDFGLGTIRNIVGITPYATGYMKDSNRVVFSGGETVTIDFINDANYSTYVELGTGARGAATYKQFLSFEDMPVWSATWLGMRAQPFVRPSVADGLNVLHDRLISLCEGAM